jgi:hypothetical protein
MSMLGYFTQWAHNGYPQRNREGGSRKWGREYYPIPEPANPMGIRFSPYPSPQRKNTPIHVP